MIIVREDFAVETRKNGMASYELHVSYLWDQTVLNFLMTAIFIIAT